MEVLKSNFEVNLPLIEEALSNADFIAIDTEFTGLTTPDVSFQNSDELPVRYSKIKNCVQEFTIIQYGVCAFKKNTDTGDYIAKPFNFYIFGADTNEVQSRRIFSATPSSLTFLRSNQFDFNKLIEEGIPFYNYSEESSMFQSTHGTNVVNRRSVISEASLTKSGKSFLEYNRKSIANWLEGNSEKPLIIQVNSAFYKKLIYQEIQDTKYNGFLKASPRDSKHLEISRVKEEDKRQSTVNTPKLNFRAVIDLIKKANCPVVAHNAAYDIFHTIDQFWQYLPNDVQEFKKVANSMWPNIVDTKYLAEFHPVLKSCFNTSVLGSLYNTVSSELQESGQDVVMAEGFDRYTGDGNGVEHEAGYDAYMTGVIYLAFIAFIREKDTDINHTNKRKRSLSEASGEESESEEESESDDDDVNDEEEKSEVDDDSKEDGEKNDSSDAESSDGEISSDEDNGGDKATSIFMDKAITPYYGRIYLMRSDIPYIDLKGEEQVNLVTYPNKFFLHNIPSGFTNTAIEKVYPNMVPFAVSWVNDNNAWIILRDETKIPHVKLGVVGLSSVHCFLPGCSRETEGEAYGITKEAGKMELITHEQWQILYGPKKTVDYSNTAEALRAATMNNITQTSEESVPTGGSGYDDLDIQLPPSFAASLKRSRDSSEDNDDASLPDAKNRKTTSS
ncbi:ribonuclease H-like domain-containing protein [Mucor mucedo]|uniref:ribonuclease H-like domain-containing protein n=1 Tax=Mucor mucedo TaxID=29922 RepID=UPI00221FA0E7|nr:ribonuclease H-like domain-containing protein [Mucor mucedo]KAI7892470.1 ribonuclease H-like domain-containing protein [Mucor mucedo]